MSNGPGNALVDPFRLVRMTAPNVCMSAEVGCGDSLLLKCLAGCLAIAQQVTWNKPIALVLPLVLLYVSIASGIGFRITRQP